MIKLTSFCIIYLSKNRLCQCQKMLLVDTGPDKTPMIMLSMCCLPEFGIYDLFSLTHASASNGLGMGTSNQNTTLFVIIGMCLGVIHMYCCKQKALEHNAAGICCFNQASVKSNSVNI